MSSIHGSNQYTEKVTEYDKNGNIKKLQRYGQTGSSTYGLVDNLTYTYNGNKVTRVDDATTATSYTGGTNFINGASTNNEYTYDANGNLTKDSNKGIANITYNLLSLPQVVTFSDGSTITYTYTHDGKKLRTVHVIGGVTTTTDYCGNVIYENGTAKKLLTDEGYVDLTTATPTYYYYLKDHQGNNRAVVNSSGTVQETNHYYPFGGLFATNGSVQDYKYNGKELNTKKGLNLYDYGARHYDAALGRWHVVDPMAEKYYSTSSYVYCLNNPIRAIDKEGKLVIFINGMHNGFQGGKSSYWNTEYGQFDAAVMKYFNDYNAQYYDGSLGGIFGLITTDGSNNVPLSNISANNRYKFGYEHATNDIPLLLSKLQKDKDGNVIESIKVITHSMGGAYGKGYVQAIKDYLSRNAGLYEGLIITEYDFAPFQPSAQHAIIGVDTYQYSHEKDKVAGNEPIWGAIQMETFNNDDRAHSIADFYDYIKSLPTGNYRYENGKFISY